MTKVNQNQTITQEVKVAQGLDEKSRQAIPVIGSESESRLDVNPATHTASSINHKKSLLLRFRQQCKFWQPILGAIAAIVSLLLALFRMLL
ncbi:hypothetical protein [Nostoc sp. ATCC 53789]|uniref:hypothetical protein n=1 Tax=Nostoc sp. ATCC 53789 TaxID=76335 RepID=UPI000DEC4CDE|nr:hypothetical protein [Nostoc sp. ATCC 53789]QHG21301.1 hypothetical protein GJB62_36290 [Nostoc sp. ATCC 53789]RCJ16201.1 hypothetical protein A6V25_31615 [Nostoc sp. ATCC 53789]